ASAGIGVERIDLRRTPFENVKPRIESRHERPLALPGSAEEVYQALVIGARDYVRKNGFQSVIIGLSGGIDSALTACVAVDALGAEHVTCVFMPTRYSSAESARDAARLAENLGVAFHIIPTEETFRQYLEILKPV